MANSRAARIAARLEKQLEICQERAEEAFASADEGSYFQQSQYHCATALIRASAQLAGLLLRIDEQADQNISGSIPQ